MTQGWTVFSTPLCPPIPSPIDVLDDLADEQIVDVKRVLLVLAVGEAAALVGLVVGLVAAHAEHVPTALVEPLLPDLGRPLDDRVNLSARLTTHNRRLSTDVANRGV